MRPRTPTVSIRKGSLVEELWLDSSGRWGPFALRKRFQDDASAMAFAAKHLGDFDNYGLFPNS